MDNVAEFTKEFMRIISQAVSKKMYGSVEIYFEAGKVTQVTQRIINKIRKKESVKKEEIESIKRETGGNGHDDLETQNTLLTS